MSLGELISSIWRPNYKEKEKKLVNQNENQNQKEMSLALNQGLQYKSFKKANIHRLEPDLNLLYDDNVKKCSDAQAPAPSHNVFHNNKNNFTLVEGFNGMLGPTAANTKNKQDMAQYQIMENNFNTSLSDYARAQQNLMSKTQNYVNSAASTNQRNKNIYASQSRPADSILPNWKGCYVGGKGLILQDDLGNSSTVASCKTRASDLGYTNFALAGGKCYVGNSDGQDNLPAYTPMVSYAFTPNKEATMGGLLKNGQVGTFKDYTSSGLVADLPAVAGCDAEVGGSINSKNMVASYGVNCNAPPKPPSTIQYHLDNTGQHMTWDSSDKYAQSKGGRLATFNELLQYINSKGSEPLVPKEDQWVAVTDGYNGAKRDWEQIGNPGYHTPGKSHVQNYGYPGWGDTLTNAAYNMYVFWISEEKTVRQQLSELCPPNKTNPKVIASNYPGINYNYDTYMFGPCTAAGTCDSTTPDEISSELLDGIKANKKCNWNRFNEGNYFYNTSPEGWAKTDCKKLWIDTNSPHMQYGCMQESWQQAGCTTVMNDADKTLRQKYFPLNASDVIKNMNAYAAATDDDHRTKCYGADTSKWPVAAAPSAPIADAPVPVPAAPVPVDCSKYGDNDSNLPYTCFQEQWKKSGCTTDPKEKLDKYYDSLPEAQRGGKSKDAFTNDYLSFSVTKFKGFIDSMIGIFDTTIINNPNTSDADKALASARKTYFQNICPTPVAMK